MPMGKCAAIGPAVDAERRAGGQAPLLGRGRGEARVADHVARREDVGHRGAEVRVHLQPPALVGLEARGPAGSGRSVAARRPAEKRTESGDDALARLEVRTAFARRAFRERRSCSTASPRRKRDVAVAHLVDQLVHDLAVEELERPVPPLDQGDRAPRGRRRSTRTRCRSPRAPTTAIVRGQLLQPDHVVGRRGSPRRRRLTPGEGAGSVPTAITMCSAVTCRRPSPAVDRQGVRIDERRRPGQDGRRRSAGAGSRSPRPRGRSRCPLPRRAAGRSGARRGGPTAGGRPFPRGPRTSTTASRRVLLGMVPVSMHDAPHAAPLLDDGGPPAELGRLHRGALAGGAAADADQIEVVGHAHSTFVGVTCQISSAYCRIVRSLENLAMLATFRMDFVVHAASSR